MITASGDCSSSAGVSVWAIATLVAASSSRLCPGFCFAPAVTTTIAEPAVTSIESDPVTTQLGTNWLPWLRSRTSARTFLAFMS